MDPDEKKLLEETFKLARENNRLVRKMYSTMRWTRFFNMLYWVLIIGAMLGAFYFIQPYINNLTDAYKTIMGEAKKAGNILNSLPNSTSSTQQ